MQNPVECSNYTLNSLIGFPKIIITIIAIDI